MPRLSQRPRGCCRSRCRMRELSCQTARRRARRARRVARRALEIPGEGEYTQPAWRWPRQMRQLSSATCFRENRSCAVRQLPPRSAPTCACETQGVQRLPCATRCRTASPMHELSHPDHEPPGDRQAGDRQSVCHLPSSARRRPHRRVRQLPRQPRDARQGAVPGLPQTTRG